jgi:acetate kinase
MKVLVLNCGSASVKYSLYDAARDRALAGGTVEDVACYDRAVQAAVAEVAGDPAEIAAVGHRFVHGGERFTGAVVLDESVAREIESFSHLAPLHNPPNLRGYRSSRAVLPDCPHVAVFDTAFHQTIPPHAYLYAIPLELYERRRVRRFGFHGASHRYITLRYAELRGRPPEEFKLIVCHLGNGCSVCAVDRGRSVDTSMGFTPLEGLVMGTRCGDLDPGALLYLMEQEGLDTAAAGRLLNRECGLRGLSGSSHDMRELLARAANGDERARLAVDVFCHRAKKHIGASFAVLNGADAVIFTGGIGENAAPVRAQICDGLSAFGISLDPEKNAAARGREMDISAAGAATRVWVIPTCEELLIARETLAAIGASRPVAP